MSDFPVVHFEMPYDDGARAASFYQQAFGWNIEETGAEMGNYILLGTTPVDAGRPLERGAINGGIYPRQPDAPTPGACVACNDINDAIERILDAGGTVHGEPRDIPGVGLYVAFSDTEGNNLSLMQPHM